MAALPQATPLPKYASVAQEIQGEIARGKWEGGRMPSVRGIAKEHAVSVVTASRALQVLRDKGLIQTIERSGCYLVPPPGAELWAVCARVTPGAWQGATAGVVRAGFEALAGRHPMGLDFTGLDVRAGLTPGDAAAMVAATGVHGVVLLPNRVSDEETRAEVALLAGCRDAQVPVVLIERNLRGHQDLAADLVALDDANGATACTRHLFDIGRRRVGVVVASPVSSHDQRVAGYLFAVHEAKARWPDCRDVVIRERGNVESEESIATVADDVEKAGLDGVVCYSDYTALGLIVELLRRGRRVPADIAVTGFDNLPLGDAFPPGVTTYDYPGEALADQAVGLLRERIKAPNRPPVRVDVPARLIVRGSTSECHAPGHC
ncbi:GntR family transcriptional regulator [Fimbriiglobus ruber]|uniref:Transcriptional regulator, LacI family n=1 Tax=Fimbriiglobus ruber TaxID=1908690 RepID=A0A225E4W4_9BACT|nr:GntR family transcriptional regulator [Fimbriiglobus ruber]OWK43725.1 transcriptional regulator, LacI family [Fimbriiglobus ruber]